MTNWDITPEYFYLIHNNNEKKKCNEKFDEVTLGYILPAKWVKENGKNKPYGAVHALGLQDTKPKYVT